MGHTVPPFTWQFKKEEGYFSKFLRALLLADDKKRFREMWRKAEFHMPAAEKASHPLPAATILMMINLEQEKAIYQMAQRLQTQAQKISELEKRQAQDQARLLYLNKRLESAENEIESRLAAFRQEMLAIKFVEYDYNP